MLIKGACNMDAAHKLTLNASDEDLRWRKKTSDKGMVKLVLKIWRKVTNFAFAKDSQ